MDITHITNWASTYMWVKGLNNDSQTRELITTKVGELAVSYDLFGSDILNWDITKDATQGDSCIIDPNNYLKINVKTNLFPELEESVETSGEESDIYALVIINPQTWDYEIGGYISAEEFISDKFYVTDYKDKGERYVVNSKNLLSYTEASDKALRIRKWKHLNWADLLANSNNSN
jgi:hypothetical protein